MPYDPDKHHRRSIRLKDYDYRQPGAYFVTLCVQDRAALFGNVSDGVVRHNDAGAMVQTVWEELPACYPGVDIDDFVVMPNHMHGILVLLGTARTETALSVGDVVQRFKTMTARRYVDGVKRLGWPAFPGRLWQRNYYEHIIRGDAALDRLTRYILENPSRWAFDDENPDKAMTWPGSPNP